MSVASAVKWTQRHRETGSAAAKPMGGRRHDVMAEGLTVGQRTLEDVFLELTGRELRA